ncbi:MAG: hypothetical protein LBQ97_02225 [Fusobacteriaceae bacterium]|jgi:V/A-type H+-transporting ATPase subunit E|nr:hypothetical protein [Fusobacteriaceae bacterium]
MDIQFQELIDKIKKDGIESAEAASAQLKAEAEKNAQDIVAAAKKEAAGIVEKAKEDAEHQEKAGIAAIEQASRNLVLSFKTEIENLLGKLLQKNVSELYSGDVLKGIIPKVVSGWAGGCDRIDVILDEKELAGLTAWSKQALSEEIKKGVSVKAGKNIGAGFRIGEKDGSAYYDFSAEAVAEALSEYLNPVLAEIMKKSAGEV